MDEAVARRNPRGPEVARDGVERRSARRGILSEQSSRAASRGRAETFARAKGVPVLLLGGRTGRQAQAGRARASQAGLRSQMPRARFPLRSGAAGKIRRTQLYDPIRDAAGWRDTRR